MPHEVVLTLVNAFVPVSALLHKLWEIIHLVAASAFCWVTNVADNGLVALRRIVIADVALAVDNCEASPVELSGRSYLRLHFEDFGTQILQYSLVLCVTEELIHVLTRQALQVVRHAGVEVLVFVAVAVPTPVLVWDEETEYEALRRLSFRQVLVPVG